MENITEHSIKKTPKETSERIMQTLSVKDFSCIKLAKITLAPLTIIIGPQASGKSVISKLLYFCTSIITDSLKNIADHNLNITNLNKHTIQKFYEWFPISAWGDKRFCIEFSLSEFEIKITRIGKSEKIRLVICDQYNNIYSTLQKNYSELIEKTQNDPEEEFYDLKWKFREYVTSANRKWLGTSHIESQLFIPAGRSFFTSIGKALVAFESSGIMDPITVEFGRRFTALRETYLRRMPKMPEDQKAPVSILFSEILGGQLKSEAGKEYIQTKDGRLTPYSALSSGQQELLPLAISIRSMLPYADQKMMMRPTRRTIYIEEPEAHLFPRAQNKLVEILSALVSKRRFNNLLITTHSPYVLSKFNNLIKAGQLGSLHRRNKANDIRDLAKIVPDTSWLLPGTVSAYAIIDGKTAEIMDESGLIAADYLDDVSGDIAHEFQQLLQYEFSK